MRRTLALIIVVQLLALFPVKEAWAVDRITLQLNWVPTAAFAGYYQARSAGLYEAEDLDVTMVHGGPEIDPIREVVEGRAEIGVTGAKRLLAARAAGQEVRAVAAIFRRSPIVFISDQSLGLTDPRQFAGLKVRATPDLEPALRAIMRRVGVADDGYKVVSLPSDVDLFESGEVPVWGAHISGLALRLEDRGHRLNYVFPSDYGVVTFGGLIFATDTYLAANRETVVRFLRATLAGFQTAIEDVDLAAALVQEQDPSADPAFMARRMASTIPLIHTGIDSIGWMAPEAWERIVASAKVNGQIPLSLRPEDVYTLDPLRDLLGQSN